MMELINIALNFPTILFTGLLFCVLVFWFLVTVGGAALDSLDLNLHANHDLPAEASHDVHIAHGGLMPGILGILNIGTVPLSIIASAAIAFTWLYNILASLYLSPYLSASIWGTLLGIVLALFSLIAGTFTAGMITRPFRRFFITATAMNNETLVDQICTITSSKVTATFGEASIKTEGSPLILAVRCSRENKLMRGKQAVILKFDAEQNTYQVAPLGIAADGKPSDALKIEDLQE